MHHRFLATFAVMLAMLGSTVVASPAHAAPLVDRTNVDFSAGGLSSQYHVYASGLDADKPMGLLLQFHGDGAFEFRYPSSSYSLGGPTGIVAEARAHNLITVPVLSPDKEGTVTWWESGSENADYVKSLLAHLRSQYPSISSDRIWLVGYSGGAQFITQFFLPKHSSTIAGGGSVVFGGGGAARVAPQPFAASLKSSFPMLWYTGLADDGSAGTYNALRDARAGSAQYRDWGFDVELETPADVGHNLSGRFGAIVGEHLAAHVPAASSPAPAPAPVVEDYEAVRTPHGMVFSGTTGPETVVLRASKYPLSGQTGWYLYGRPDSTGTVTIELTKFARHTPYYWQLETLDGKVLVSGQVPSSPSRASRPGLSRM